MYVDDWYYSKCYAANLQCSRRYSDYAIVVCYSANAVCKGGSYLEFAKSGTVRRESD
jgi:hypothetical protein